MKNSKSTAKKKEKGFKNLRCKYCDDIVNRVDVNAVAVTCSACTHKLVEGQILDY